MRLRKFRKLLSLIVVVVIATAYVASQPVGTLSAIGWKDVSLLCPLGALGDMIATKSVTLRILIALVFAVASIFILGRAFCGWVCPVPVMSRLRGAFSSKKKCDAKPEAENEQSRGDAELAPEEVERLKDCTHGCGTCASKKDIDSRHIVLGGALLSTAVFGFPVFCLVCPIGLAFATVFLLFNLFAYADLTWGVVFAPALLLVEVVFFRKWCSHVCPISALMSLVSKKSRTFQIAVDRDTCLEGPEGTQCGICRKVCDQGIDPRHPERGNSWSECTKCRDCIESCPGKAITMPFLPGETTDMPVVIDVPKEES